LGRWKNLDAYAEVYNDHNSYDGLNLASVSDDFFDSPKIKRQFDLVNLIRGKKAVVL
tara:strand:+ start:1542 stop:1712 length:171 start_codon:yes stop_codon:yes gene_type:complete